MNPMYFIAIIIGFTIVFLLINKLNYDKIVVIDDHSNPPLQAPCEIIRTPRNNEVPRVGPRPKLSLLGTG